MSLARPTLFVHCRTHRRLRANTSGKIKRFSGCYYRLQLFRTATAGCSCTPQNRNWDRFWEKRCRWHNANLGRCDRDGREQPTSLDKTESLSMVFMCGVSTQKWPSNQITVFERTRSTLWRHRWQKASEFLCTDSFWRVLSNQKYCQKTQKCSLRRATNVMFSKPRGARF